MLGLGSAITSSGDPILPALSFNAASVVYLTTTTSPDEGTGAGFGQATTSTFDIRLLLSLSDYDTASDGPNQFTFTDITVQNTTTGSAVQTLTAGPLVADSEIDVAGAGVLIYIFDDSSAMDNVDLGSSSGATAAHNGSDSNTFRVSFNVARQGFSGVVAFTKDFSLSDSDA